MPATESRPTPLPYLTADLPGIGGFIKQRNEDFEVEELPLYEASGSGTHTYLLVEKVGMTTPQVADAIARHLGVRPRDVGYAGLKDAHAVTRQFFSVEHVDAERLPSLGGHGWRVLRVGRHANKLRTGHLRGNRFIIKVRDLIRPDPVVAEAIVEVLTTRGVPNYFDAQRFGARGDNAAIGLAAIRGDFEEALAILLGRPNEHDRGPVREARLRFDSGDLHAAARLWPHKLADQRRACQALLRFKGDAARAWATIDGRLRDLYVSALQSELFNRVVVERLSEIDRVRTGDLAWKHDNGAVFRVTDELVEQPRCRELAISPSGPLFGTRMTAPEGVPAEIEAGVLATIGLTPAEFGREVSARANGARRPLRYRPIDVDLGLGADEFGPYLRLAFSLDAGCYATIFVRELCKSS